MGNFCDTLELKTDGQQLIEITSNIIKFLKKSNVKNDLLNLSILPTSASLVIQENASTDVLHDLNVFLIIWHQ